MSLRCEPGEPAMVVAPYAEPGRGAIVQVLRRASSYEEFGGYSWSEAENAWIVEGWVREWRGLWQGPLLVVADSCLKPLRGGAGADEVLLRVGLPAQPKKLPEVVS